ncbi:hypothetical protein MtrunA17_Chr4g0011801 [Medicago truncatula]|uniref:Uncharacterized protein n=1 Tax=Medicago truncatula TaxID=3880 RepID=A0A396I6L9_MEDTR|nr:hypothetical protein MtrunA17_Chr4g0011801 [Medicago truncatula]
MGLFVIHYRISLVGQIGYVLRSVQLRFRSGFEVGSQIRIILGLSCAPMPQYLCQS